MITIKNEKEIALMKKAGEIVYLTHQKLIPYIKEGITTKQLDEIAEKFIISMNATPSFKNYNGYPTSICTSINEEVVHGIPTNRTIKNGDIISIDIGACYKGYHGDSAWSYKVGEVSTEKAYLLHHTEEALYEGIKKVKPGNYLNDIGTAIEKYAKAHHLGVVRELVGHGVGKKLHEEPDVPNYNIKRKGPLLKEGMTIAIEPMLNLGTHRVFILDDGWTIVTGDNKPSAHFEHTVVVTKNGCEILTKKG